MKNTKKIKGGGTDSRAPLDSGRRPSSSPSSALPLAGRRTPGRPGARAAAAGRPAAQRELAHAQGPAHPRPTQGRHEAAATQLTRGGGGLRRWQLVAARGGRAVPATVEQGDRGKGRREAQGAQEVLGRVAVARWPAQGRSAAGERRRWRSHGGEATFQRRRHRIRRGKRPWRMSRAWRSLRSSRFGRRCIRGGSSTEGAKLRDER